MTAYSVLRVEVCVHRLQISYSVFEYKSVMKYELVSGVLEMVSFLEAKAI